MNLPRWSKFSEIKFSIQNRGRASRAIHCMKPSLSGKSITTQTDINNSKLRLFYALWPDQAVRESFTQLQNNVDCSQGSKTQKHNFHLTLIFLGEQSASSVPTLNSILEKAPDTGIQLEINQRTYFRNNRIVAANIRVIPNSLQTLHHYLLTELSNARICFQSASSYHPHITLARKAVLPTSSKPDLITPFSWQVREVTLMQSVFSKSGVRYDVLARRILKPSLSYAEAYHSELPDAVAPAAVEPQDEMEEAPHGWGSCGYRGSL